MGTDIHGLIEFKDENGWHGLADGEWFIVRDYQFFGMIADIRNDGMKTPISLRGLPSSYSPELHRQISIEVWDDSISYQSMGTVSSAMAESYVQDKKSSYCGRTGYEKSYIFDPDWHSYGWLCIRDFESIFIANNKTINDLYPDQKVLIEVMKVLENNYGEDNVRFVFWFDN